MSLVLQDSKDKSFLLNIMDTPGHANFRDEVTQRRPRGGGCNQVTAQANLQRKT